MVESYQGTKFKTEIIGEEVPNNPRLEELKHWCQIFHKCDLTPQYEGGSYGNLSFRLQDDEDQFIITSSQIGFSDWLQDYCFTRVSSCDLRKRIVYAYGVKSPSSESMLHYAIYHQRNDVHAIFHGHSKKILSCVKKLKIPETTQEEPYGTAELVQRVLEILDNKSFLIMKNHGFISLGSTMEETGKLTLQIYKKCLQITSSRAV